MNIVTHIWGIAVSPALDLIEEAVNAAWGSSDESPEWAETVHAMGEEGNAFIGIEVEQTDDGVVVTDAVRSEGAAALAALPADLVEAIRSRMLESPLGEADRAVWASGGIPAPSFHVVPYSI